MKDLHPLDVRNRDGGLPTAQAVQPRSLRQAHKAGREPENASKGPWSSPEMPASNHGVAHGSKVAAAKASFSKPAIDKPAPAQPRPVAATPAPRRRSGLPFLIFLGVIGYWAYANLVPADMQNLVQDQIKAATK